ncbi:MAG: AraC family transcriptional regulator, partial [Acetatifactor sp.]|nr:AraC family transcriptional regulator [Acetatifactor sp.]
LLDSISHYDTEQRLRILKKLLDQLLVNGGGNIKLIKDRLSELLVMISRTAINCGVQDKEAMYLLKRFRKASPSLGSFDDLSAWLVKLLEDFLNSFLRYPEAKHSSSINSCIQYLHAHYSRQVSLLETAQYIGLSPSYLSRIFKAETGISLNQYLNQIRISKAKKLLRHTELRLLDIASLTGFEDQSYFTKVFRRITGISPLAYRQKAQLPASDQEEHI